MRREVRFAAAARDDGIRKVGKLTWQAGVVGVVGSALIALAFSHHEAAQATGSGSSSSSSSPSSTGSGGISVPAQPPGSGQGSGQVTSGAS
jgi:hypothetical protein